MAPSSVRSICGKPATADVQVRRGPTRLWRGTGTPSPPRRADDVPLKIDDVVDVYGVVDTTTRQTPTTHRGSIGSSANARI